MYSRAQLLNFMLQIRNILSTVGLDRRWKAGEFCT